jgi:hypothetical protein
MEDITRDMRRDALARALAGFVAAPPPTAPPPRPVYRSPVVLRHEPLRGRASKHRVGRARARWL